MSQNVENPQTPANGLYVGEIRLLPFRHDELPFGWHFCNGERFLLTSPQGEVLSGLSENFRADWGLEEDLCSISLPNLFHEDGRGCFLRPVDGLTRQVGAEQEDALGPIEVARDLYSGVATATGLGISTAGSGFVGFHVAEGVSYGQTPGGNSSCVLARGVRFGSETTVLNLGMTPAIYLGV